MFGVPGFTATASLQPPLQHYATTFASLANIAPAQLPIRNGGYDGGDRDYCTPQCGPCHSSVHFSSGCSQTCTTALCHQVERSCHGCVHPCTGAGGTFCGQVCTATGSDSTNCGSCGHVCPAGAGCRGGVCVCPSSQVDCNGICVDPMTDPNNCGDCSVICSANQMCCNGTCTDTLGTVPGSNMNYFLVNQPSCTSILGFTVMLQVTDTIASDNGFTIQLNGCSTSATVQLQQYGFIVSGTDIKGFINNWSDGTTAIVCDHIDLCKTPINNAIPTGYTLSLSLLNDASGNVIGATYQVFDGNGALQANKNFLVSQSHCNCTFLTGFTCNGFQAGSLSPLTTVSLDIVGPGNSARANFSGGAGVLTYSTSTGTLAAQVGEPTCGSSICGTAETSNAAYGLLTPCSSGSLVHSFSITPDPASSRVCFTSSGPCTGAGGQNRCITVAGTTQCCHSNWFWGQWPSISSCSDGTVTAKSCNGPCW